jgi:hypothetical protein
MLFKVSFEEGAKSIENAECQVQQGKKGPFIYEAPCG